MGIQTNSYGYTWDPVVRWFHWINALSVIALGAIGSFILFGSDLGLSDEGKVALKTIHVLIGYVLVTNLLVRLVWAFVGSSNARWSALLPGGRGFGGQLKSQLRNFWRPEGHKYPAHSPIGRIAVALMFALIVVQACTGLLLAGTDIYYPPFGRWFAEWVAAEGVSPGLVAPYQPELVDEAAYKEMRAFRSPFAETHKFVFFTLLFMVPAHIAGVIVAEIKSRAGLVSAMIHGARSTNGEDSRAG